MFYIIIVLHFLIILLMVAFFTLFERKVMGSFHIRLGPNKISFFGMIQPLIDAFKLFGKSGIYPFMSSYNLYKYSPSFSLMVSLLIYILMPFSGLKLNSNTSFLCFILMSTLMILFLLINGWVSNSKYSLMGSLRSISQAISYEAVFSSLVLLIMLIHMSVSIFGVMSHSSSFNLLFLSFWLISTLGETHRAPFDFSEAESELVSGFNTEFSGKNFAFLFLSEYIMLLFSSLLFTYIFIAGIINFWNSILLQMGAMVVAFIFIWFRITFCRFRYDLLMNLAWKTLLPLLLMAFLLSIFIL